MVTDTPIDFELDQISDRLRLWREERGLTRQELADLSGVAASTVHKVEARQMTPSIAVVLKLAHGLGRRPSEILAEAAPFTTVSIHRVAEAKVTVTPSGSFERLTGDLPDPELEAWRVTFQSGSSSGRPLRLDGEVLLICEEGELTLTIDGDDQRLAPGDAAHFKGSQQFSYRNGSQTPTRFMIAATLHGDLRSMVNPAGTRYTKQRPQ